jgi:hypothetical protein
MFPVQYGTEMKSYWFVYKFPVSATRGIHYKILNENLGTEKNVQRTNNHLQGGFSSALL